MSAKSPFPGMDPYLEAHWLDIHASMVIYVRDELQQRLPGDLRARVGERVIVESDRGACRSIYPDVRVVEHRGPSPAPHAPSPTSGTALAEPLILHIGDEPMTQTFIEVVEVGPGERLVTVIEVLSPTNKSPGEGRDQYRKKQRELREGRVSLVEIDLLRDGEHVLSVPLWCIPTSHRTPYLVSVRRGYRPLEAEIYAMTLPRKLPAIAVPLRESDADVELDLQSIVERCYENGRYEGLDYSKKLMPPLDPEEARWADELLRAAGRR